MVPCWRPSVLYSCKLDTWSIRSDLVTGHHVVVPMCNLSLLASVSILFMCPLSSHCCGYVKRLAMRLADSRRGDHLIYLILLKTFSAKGAFEWAWGYKNQHTEAHPEVCPTDCLPKPHGYQPSNLTPSSLWPVIGNKHCRWMGVELYSSN